MEEVIKVGITIIIIIISIVEVMDIWINHPEVANATTAMCGQLVDASNPKIVHQIHFGQVKDVLVIMVIQ
jgi:hypothetical protein